MGCCCVTWSDLCDCLLGHVLCIIPPRPSVGLTLWIMCVVRRNLYLLEWWVHRLFVVLGYLGEWAWC